MSGFHDFHVLFMIHVYKETPPFKIVLYCKDAAQVLQSQQVLPSLQFLQIILSHFFKEKILVFQELNLSI